MCMIHDQQFACGCWRRTDVPVTPCPIARTNTDPNTGAPVTCPLSDCKAKIRPSYWYCIECAPCKQFTGNYESLKQNFNQELLAHVLETGDYNFPLRPPGRAFEEAKEGVELFHRAASANKSTTTDEGAATKQVNEYVEAAYRNSFSRSTEKEVTSPQQPSTQRFYPSLYNAQ